MGVDKVTYWFIKLTYHFKIPNSPLTECAMINNRLISLSSKQLANGDMGQSSNRLNNAWQQWNLTKMD